MIKKRRLYYLILGIIFLFGKPITVFSNENASDLIKDFSYEVLFPENQQDKNIGYYDLLIQTGQKQVIQLKLNNTSTRQLKVEINVNSAKTNGNGVIEYGPNKLEKDVSLNYDLAEIMTGPEEVTLAPNSSETIDFTIMAPKVEFEGYITGGIQLKPIVRESDSQDGSNFIQNKFAFLIGVLLSEADTKKIKPVMKLNDVYLKLKDGVYSLFVNISNTKGVFVEKMSANIKIREKNSTKVLIDFNKKEMRMAPHSMIDLPVSFYDQKMTAGEYTADIKVTTEQGTNWTWVKNFNFTKIEAEQINKQATEKEDSSFNYWWLLLPVILLIVVILALINNKKNPKIKRS
ncbi:hypothetical protein UAW_01820 [Enterococcus haemoperoxidus ATCC BAA-382]|uniref:Uncharacterized protein n=1 Tax=Enterococcus haemoperoxidus ATCC BAA-382 TaxID=1158608 RepID=R2SNA5_9ENTE|nr:DUF916 and DUF3324 domain-containing protein [Enterococcus haemoperoxidus]EOH96655.1 hypothetical protein UAW_01820 [Enterococcus haemoperoxidus ATCC BAA-382]EOT60151.1 hypothetical protein I583_02786 [Enterococcus haemoperoxidus ATCC BAA-382]OJG51484.1 hypothetical protein RV06_GL001625 [Enterococcus haemoperoxidus]